jgi:hypothetical protein
VKTVTCQKCFASGAMGAHFSIRERILCEKCADDEIKRLHDSETPIMEDEIHRLVDSTVCSNCQATGVEWPQIAGLPVCNSCEEFFRNRPFPTWIKISLAAVLAIAVFSMVHNARYFFGYLHLRQGLAASAAGNMDLASDLIGRAAGEVPESAELGYLGVYLKGVSLLAKDSAIEALPYITAYRDANPADPQAGLLLLTAQCAAAYDRGEYDEMERYATEAAAAAPGDAMAVAAVASAKACRYAASGDSAVLAEGYEMLARAEMIAANDPEMSVRIREYKDRILFRLATREIISREEFERRFPNGWKPVHP